MSGTSSTAWRSAGGRRSTVGGGRLRRYFLTDEVFGVVAARQAPTFAYLLGAELSLFVTWNLSTLGGAFLGGAIPDPAKLGLDLVFPLAFLALLVPLVRTRVELAVAVVSGALAYVVARRLPGGVPIVVTGVAGSLLGAWLTRGRPVEELRLEDASGRSHDVLDRARRDGRGDVRLALRGSRAAHELPAFWVRFLHFVPIAVFAALVTPSLEGGLGEGEIRFVGAVATALVGVADQEPRPLDRGRDGCLLVSPDPVLSAVSYERPVSQRSRSWVIASRSPR